MLKVKPRSRPDSSACIIAHNNSFKSGEKFPQSWEPHHKSRPYYFKSEIESKLAREMSKNNPKTRFEK